MHGCTHTRVQKRAYLKNVLERIRSFMPMMNESFVSFPHHKIQVLVSFLRDKTIVHDALFILRRESSAVLAEGVQESEAGSIQLRAVVCRRRRKRDHLQSKNRGRGEDISKGEMMHARMVIRERRAGRDNRGQDHGDRARATGRGLVESAELIQGRITSRPSREEPPMDVSRDVQTVVQLRKER
jgi:hypothetical protein